MAGWRFALGLFALGPLVALVAGGAVARALGDPGANSLAAGALAGALAWVAFGVMVSARIRSSRQSRASVRWRRNWYAAHSWLGAALGTVLCIVFVTGSVCTVRQPLRRWAAERSLWLEPLVPKRGHCPAGAACPPLDAIVEHTHQRFSGTARWALRLPGPDSPSVQTLVPAGPGGSLRHFYYEAHTGEYLGEAQSQLGDFFFQLHANWTTRSKVGRYLVGLAGIVWLVLIATGLGVHPKLHRHLTRLRFDRSARTLYSDWHKALGIWGLAFYVTLGGTGALLGLKDLLLIGPSKALYGSLAAAKRSLRPGLVAASGRPATMVSVGEQLSRAREALPPCQPHLLVFSHWGDENARLHIGGELPGQLLGKNEGCGLEYAAATAERLETTRMDEAEWFARVYASLSPLHYGDFSGALLQGLYFLWGLGGAALVFTGTAVWVQRRSGPPGKAR